MSDKNEKRLLRVLSRMQDLDLDDVMQCKRYADYAVKHGLSLEQISPLLMDLCDEPASLDPFVHLMNSHSSAKATHTRI